ncbi:para-nitrobenzyl esterase [Colletotrichum tabaci]|uniref:Carboxylic ester hydrolase n=1 Tax=Colletotrichum tabaci TaxID=1209068 RepID=A0AAV9TFT2_9PEZI
MFDGSSFASQQGIVVVTFNYRLNVFGFPNSEQLPLRAQNLGFLDQRLALEWVQANIHAFGGDPAKVTIAGESSGGSSVDRLVTTMHTNQSFRAAALSSGQATVSAIVQKVVSDHGLDFSPVNDNFTQMELPYLPTRAAGGLAPVPILIGSTGQEGTYLAPAYNLDIPNFTEPVLVQFLNGLTGGDSESVGDFGPEWHFNMEISLSRSLQTIWAGFVKDPLRNGPGWEKVDVDGNNIACIGCVGSETMTLIDSATVDGRCAFYAPFFDKVKTPFLKV